MDPLGAEVVTDAKIDSLWPERSMIHTLTADNGREFARHEEVTRWLDASIYFAHRYHSWERGSNENTKGLIRQN